MAFLSGSSGPGAEIEAWGYWLRLLITLGLYLAQVPLCRAAEMSQSRGGDRQWESCCIVPAVISAVGADKWLRLPGAWQL